MATKFITLKGTIKENKKTIFTGVLTADFALSTDCLEPKDWDNVLYLGYDRHYGDVFKAWDDVDDDFMLYFGKKGDEFDS